VFGLLSARLDYFRSPLAPGALVLLTTLVFNSFFSSITSRVSSLTRRVIPKIKRLPTEIPRIEEGGRLADMRSLLLLLLPHAGRIYARLTCMYRLPTCRRDDGTALSQRAFVDDDNDDHLLTDRPFHSSACASSCLTCTSLACLTSPYLTLPPPYFLLSPLPLLL
jgi:hypothetical protein